jgi:anaerobic magnesium-protoporphyrin IX monomethyl ester cyclase
MGAIHLIEVINERYVSDLGGHSLGLGYLMAYARKYGGYSNFRCYKASDKLELKQMPEIIGISSVTQNFAITQKLVRKLRSRSSRTKIILGGPHVSLLALSAPKEADYIVVGEGEQAFLELLDYLSKGKGRVEDIKGIYYKKDGRFIYTGERSYSKDIDYIPYPLRHRDDLKLPKVELYTSRGCPYRCQYCAATRLWNGYRLFSAEYVIGELELLIDKCGAKDISFGDDLFIINGKRLRQIAEMIRERGWHKKVSFSAIGRANLITPEVVSILKSINVVSVGLGLETGSERLLKIMKCGTVSLKQNHVAVRMLKAAGISVEGFFMIGYPGETVEDIDSTLRFIREEKIDNGGTALTEPYPGTELWEIALKRGLVSEDMDWEKFRLDFSTDFREMIILSDVDREILFEKYNEFVKIWISRQLNDRYRILRYIRLTLNWAYIKQLIQKPRKIVSALKTVARAVASQ